MSACAVEIEWAGGKQVFDLAQPKVMAAMEGRGPRVARISGGVVLLDPLPPSVVLRRLIEDTYSTRDVELVVLYGLWGGGLSIAEAHRLVEDHVKPPAPLTHGAVLAMTIVQALFRGAGEAA